MVLGVLGSGFGVQGVGFWIQGFQSVKGNDLVLVLGFV